MGCRRQRDQRRGDDVSVIKFIPIQRLLQIRSQDRDSLPVDVIDGGCEEQQSANGPSIDTGTRLDRRIRLDRCGFHFRGDEDRSNANLAGLAR
jgi:hypothetical protein